MAFGIYVHWPFCAAKCPYCDFNSHVRARDRRSRLDERHRAANWNGRRSCRAMRARMVEVDLLWRRHAVSDDAAHAVAPVLDAIAQLWPMAHDVEITLESNPASADAARFRDYRAAGVNRLSLGVQALNDADLKFLGRLHNVAEAKAALAMAMADVRSRLARSHLCAAGANARAMARGTDAKRSRSAPSICRSISSPSSPRRRSPRSRAPAR